MGWFESFCFTLGWQLRKQEKKERNEQAKLRAFRADCFDHYEEAVVNLQKRSPVLWTSVARSAWMKPSTLM